MATHSSILAWRIPWTEELGGLQSMRSQRVGRDWTTKHTHSGAFSLCRTPSWRVAESAPLLQDATGFAQQQLMHAPAFPAKWDDDALVPNTALTPLVTAIQKASESSQGATHWSCRRKRKPGEWWRANAGEPQLALPSRGLRKPQSPCSAQRMSEQHLSALRPPHGKTFGLKTKNILKFTIKWFCK